MFEARLMNSAVSKKVLEAIKELLSEASFDCSESGIHFQAMDNSHVSLVSLTLRADGFDKYRCDRNMTMRMNLGNLVTIFKCANNDDTVTIKAQDDADTVSFMFGSKEDKVPDYEIKLVNLDQEHLGIQRPISLVWSKFLPPNLQGFAEICLSSENLRISAILNEVSDFPHLVISALLVLSWHRPIISMKKRNLYVLKCRNQLPTLNFVYKYLNAFTKATPLTNQVTLSMSDNVPFVVEYQIPDLGHLEYHLAPKKEDDEN